LLSGQAKWQQKEEEKIVECFVPSHIAGYVNCNLVVQRSMTCVTKAPLENKEETQKQTLSESNRWWFPLQQCQPDLTAKLAQTPV
jgi:hypothetical protein